MTIQIPDDLARGLEGIAMVQHKSVEQVAVESLRQLVDRKSSPTAISCGTIRQLPHPSVAAVDDLEAAILAGRLPVQDEGAFDGRQAG